MYQSYIGWELFESHVETTFRPSMVHQFQLTMYSLHFKVKVTFGYKLRYEIKVTFGEISLKLCQTNWNIAIDNVTTKSNNNLHSFNNWYLVSTMVTHIDVNLCISVPAAQNGGHLEKLAAKFFDFTMDIPVSPEST